MDFTKSLVVKLTTDREVSSDEAQLKQNPADNAPQTTYFHQYYRATTVSVREFANKKDSIFPSNKNLKQD